MALTMGVGLCTLPFLFLLLVPWFGWQGTLLVAVPWMVVLAVVCWVVCGRVQDDVPEEPGEVRGGTEGRQEGSRLRREGAMKRLTIRGTGLALGLFFDVTFLLCVFWAAVVPARWETMAKVWEVVLPGFTWLTPWSLGLGVVELFLYGLYTALVFVPLFNFFEGGTPAEVSRPTGQALPREAVTHHARP